MKKYSPIVVGIFSFLALSIPLAFADASSVSVQSVSPGSTVLAKNNLTFTVVTSGFSVQLYRFSDSFLGSTASVNNLDMGGNFSWVPVGSDVGTHTFTIISSNYNGDIASTTETIVVMPAPSLAIHALSPGLTVNPGTKATFTVTATGFTNPSYSISDTFSNGSSIGNSNIDSSGNFSWTPDLSQNGDHVIAIYASDSLGHNALVTQSLHVGGWPTITVTSLSPGANVFVGTTTSFAASPSNFLPSLFEVVDSFPGSSISNNNITSGGFFSWVPQTSDIGVHTLTIKGSVGSFGQSVTTTETIKVFALGSVIPPTPASPSPASTPTPTPPVQPTAPVPQGTATPTSGAVAPTTTSAVSAFTSYLHSGMQGSEVTRLQTVLAQQGFFSSTPNGLFGPLTTSAVMKFQAAHKLTQVGTVGPATRALLNALSSTNPQTATSSTSTATPQTTNDGYVFKNFMGFGEDTTDGTDVLELQKRLTALGFFSGDATGVFGNVTASAVKKFQKAHGIEATGYVGSVTRAALNQ